MFLKEIFRNHRCPVPTCGHEEKFVKVPLLKLYLKANLLGFKYRKAFRDVEIFCVFLGYSRSGHSIIGSLLDAHPNIIISHEADALGLIKRRIFSRTALFSLLLENSRMFSRVERGWSGKSYKVSGQWQGKFSKLKVIGDKKGEGSTYALIDNPNILKTLKKTVGIRVKYIHHTRNPYDIISKWCVMNKREGPAEELIRSFFSLCETVDRVKKEIPNDQLFEGTHESFISDPKGYLRRLCCFLGVDPIEEYLEACTKIVYGSPHLTRKEISWDVGSINLVKTEMNKYDFLRNYSFEE